MTPKEKAIELTNKMHNTKHCGIDHFPNKNYCDCSEINFFQAKQCALIAVDEILNEKLPEFNQIKIDFWLDVRNEINNL